MSEDKILAKAIDKAKKNGFKVAHSGKDLVDFLYDVYMEYGIKGDYSFIFSHDFTKAFWGEEEIVEEFPDRDLGGFGVEFMGGTMQYPYYESGSVTVIIPCWKFHLQQMVLEEDPIKYLEKFL